MKDKKKNTVLMKKIKLPRGAYIPELVDVTAGYAKRAAEVEKKKYEK
jgi:hypothetical protein